MAYKVGHLNEVSFHDMRSLGIQMGSNEYPKGTIQFFSYWRNNNSIARGATVWLCDSNGNNSYKLFDLNIGAKSSDSNHKTANIDAPNLKGKALYLKFTNINEPYSYSFYYANGSDVWVDYVTDAFSVSCSAGTGGSLSASTYSATPGSTVTLYPSASTGYYFTGFTTSPALTITNNSFVMPSQAVSITANFALISYSITKGTNPAGAGTVSGPGNATMGAAVSFSQTPATGYYFNGWTTSPAGLGNSFTMPAQNVTVIANYLRRSTGSLNKTSMTGGTSVVLSISTENAGYTHKYKLSFGSGMETSLTDVGAGVTSVTISVPESWSNSIPSSATKSGGTLVLYTYSGSTQIGSYTISSLTYVVPTSAGPTIAGLTTAIARTIGGITYANIGEIYTQLHCGVRIQATSSARLSATINKMTAGIAGYSGASFNGSSNSGSIDFTTGLLPVAGTITVSVTATDSRGYTATGSLTIQVTAYNPPGGVLSTRRVDFDGNDDDVGQYAKYALEKTFSQIGTNSLTVTLTSQGHSEVITADTGNVLPGSRQIFSLQQEYTISVTLTDAFETTVITAKLRSGRFILFVNAGGNKMGLMKATTKNIPAGKDSTIEFSGDSQIYIGEDTLEDYIRQIVQSM